MVSSAELMAIAQQRVVKKSLEIDGVRADYWFYPSTSENPAVARNIVLVHGYRGDHHGLEAFSGGLTAFNVYAPDLPGFGTSEPMKKKHDLNNYAKWLLLFSKELQLEKPIAIGHSFGTLVVAAAQAKEKFANALVFINAVGGGGVKGVAAFLLNFIKFYYWFAHVIPEALGLKMLKARILVDSMSNFTTKSKDKVLRAWIKEQHNLHFNSFSDSQVVWESYIASISNTITPFLPEIKEPILFIAAELDEITPVSSVVQMSEEMPNAQMHLVLNCGHLVHYEAAEETLVVINSFLSKLD